MSELNALLDFEEIQYCPVLILANKIDKYGAAGEDEVKDFFNLDALLTGKVYDGFLIDVSCFIITIYLYIYL